MMLVGFGLPVLLETVALKKAPPNNASRFLYIRVFGWVWLLLLKANHPNDNASRFLYTSAVLGSWLYACLFFKKMRTPK